MNLFHKKRRNWKTPLLWSVGGLFLLTTLLIISLPLIFSPTTMRPKIEQALRNQMNFPAHVDGDISFRFFPHPLIRAKHISIGAEEEKILIDKVDFHTSVFSLFSQKNLLSDLTFHRAEIFFENFKSFFGFLSQAGQQKNMESLTLKKALIKVGETIFDPVDFSIYRESNDTFFSFMMTHDNAQLGVKGNFSDEKVSPINAILKFKDGKTLEAKGSYIPQNKSWSGKIEGDISSNFSFLEFPFLDKILSLHVFAKVETNFSDISFDAVRLLGNDFDFNGKIDYLKKDGWEIQGQLSKIPSFLEDISSLEKCIKYHPRGKINLTKKSVLQLESFYDGEVLEIKKAFMNEGDIALEISASGTRKKEDFSLAGEIAYRQKGNAFKGSFFATSDFFEIKNGQYKLGNQDLKGDLLFNSKQKSLDAVLSTSHFSFSKMSIFEAFKGWVVDLKLTAENAQIKNQNFSSLVLHALLNQKDVLIHSLQARANRDVISVSGSFEKKKDAILFSDFKIEGRKLDFLKSFSSNLSFEIVPFPVTDSRLKTTVELNGFLENLALKWTQKTSQTQTVLLSHFENNKMKGKLSFQSLTLAPLYESVPYLRGKIKDSSLYFSGDFEQQQSYIIFPTVNFRIGENTFKGSLEKNTLQGDSDWKIALESDTTLFSSLVESSDFAVDIFDGTTLVDWEDLLQNKIEFSLKLKNVMDTRLGKEISLNFNTKSFPQHFEIRLLQDNGDARVHLTHEGEKYQGFAHFENYFLPKPLLENRDINILFGRLTLESEFETEGHTPHTLFKNMIASLKLSAKDSTLFGLSPFYAIENAKEALGGGEHAVRRGIIRGLKSGKAPLETFSCRGILKEGKFLLKYGRFGSPEIDNGTFTAQIEPLRKSVKIQSRFGLNGLHSRPIDLIWKLDGSLFNPQKTVRITSPYAYDSGYLKRRKRKK